MTKLLLGAVLIGAAVLAASCIHRSPGEPPLVVNVRRDGQGCRVSVEGDQVPSERLLEIARTSGKRRGIVVFEKDTPYRCIGGAIFTLQRAGLSPVEAVVWDGA